MKLVPPNSKKSLVYKLYIVPLVIAIFSFMSGQHWKPKKNCRKNVRPFPYDAEKQ
jgi:hypothetical protein